MKYLLRVNELLYIKSKFCDISITLFVGTLQPIEHVLHTKGSSFHWCTTICVRHNIYP